MWQIVNTQQRQAAIRVHVETTAAGYGGRHPLTTAAPYNVTHNPSIMSNGSTSVSSQCSPVCYSSATLVVTCSTTSACCSRRRALNDARNKPSIPSTYICMQTSRRYHHQVGSVSTMSAHVTFVEPVASKARLQSVNHRRRGVQTGTRGVQYGQDLWFACAHKTIDGHTDVQT